MDIANWNREDDVASGEVFFGDPWPWTEVRVTYWSGVGVEIEFFDEDLGNRLPLGVFKTTERAMDALTALESGIEAGKTRFSFCDDLDIVTRVELAANVTRFSLPDPGHMESEWASTRPADV